LTRDLHAVEREALLERARRLEWLTVGWNAVEGVVAIAAAVAASSVVLLGFGLDSFVEMTSGLVILWRIRAERRARDEARIERVEYLARRGVAVSLFLLAAFVATEAVVSLVGGEEPSTSVVGMVLLATSIVVMLWLARAKRSVARRLHSHAMEADATQTDICWQLSVVALVGLGANAAFGWWWADPIAALGMAMLIAREGWDAWQQKSCCTP
jgi:cation diffusion facilitator family transporter